jgi:hypothetical protein
MGKTIEINLGICRLHLIKWQSSSPFEIWKEEDGLWKGNVGRYEFWFYTNSFTTSP